MEYIASFFSILFITLIIGSAIAIGLVALLWFIGAAMVLGIIFYLRESVRRWLFLRRADPEPYRPSPPGIIEGDYKDITGNKPE